MRTRYLIRDSLGSTEVDESYIKDNASWFVLTTTMVVDDTRVEEYINREDSIITVRNRKWWHFKK